MGGGRETDMITNIRIRNFKVLEDAELKLGAAPVVLIGPNNCGKTSILQALTMWHVGAKEWQRQYEAAQGKKRRGFRGVGITLDKFPALVVPNFNLLWRERRVMEGMKGRVRISIQVDGETGGKKWRIGTQFQYHKNIVYCAPMLEGGEDASPSEIAARWRACLPKVRFLQPMSGIAKEEYRLLPESADAEISRGNTAGVLRNACYHLLHPDRQNRNKPEAQRSWKDMVKCVQVKFGVELEEPELDGEGRVLMTYKDVETGKRYDLSSGGRGFHQTLLLLSYLYGHPNSVILMDEPDAHLEIVRQRDNFTLLREVANSMSSQLIIASHSEVVMSAAAQKGRLVSVVRGAPENLSDQAKIFQFKKLLTTIGWEKFAQAAIRRHVVFLEGETDIDMMAAFARKLHGNTRAEFIRRANISLVEGNQPQKAKDEFYGLENVVDKLRGYALFDRVPERKLQGGHGLLLECWKRREVENYLKLPDVLHQHAKQLDARSGSLFHRNPDMTCAKAMDLAVRKNTAPAHLDDPKNPFWRDSPMSEYIVQVLRDFYRNVPAEVRWGVGDLHNLIDFMHEDEIPAEVREKILAVLKVIDPDFDPEESEFSGGKE